MNSKMKFGTLMGRYYRRIVDHRLDSVMKISAIGVDELNGNLGDKRSLDRLLGQSAKERYLEIESMLSEPLVTASRTFWTEKELRHFEFSNKILGAV
jgi:hypothetical protein